MDALTFMFLNRKSFYLYYYLTNYSTTDVTSSLIRLTQIGETISGVININGHFTCVFITHEAQCDNEVVFFVV